jgi:23S rRNA (uracil1939-C5)-methyltransferase
MWTDRCSTAIARGMNERVLIDRVGHQGDGVAKTPGGPVFVPYTLPGEEAAVEKNGERARLIELVTESPERIAPICPYFGTCGGCALQHWQEKSYCVWKRDLVVTALEYEGIRTEVGDLIDAHGAGRRRVVLHAKRGGGKNFTVGFTARRSHAIVEIDRCPVLAPSLTHVFEISRRIAELLTPKDKPLDIQFTATDSGLDIDVRGSGPLNSKLISSLAKIAADERLARLTRHGEIVTQLSEPALTIGSARVVLPPGAFLQATQAGEEALADAVISTIRKTKHIADLFCGVGTFALRLAGHAKILAVDSEASAIAALSRAAKTPGLKPVETITRDLFRRPLVDAELKDCDTVVLNPPRQGAEAQTRELAKAKIARIIYVSCNPASFARDAKILTDAGFKLLRVKPVDQFRYSPHVELVGVFER